MHIKEEGMKTSGDRELQPDKADFLAAFLGFTTGAQQEADMKNNQKGKVRPKKSTPTSNPNDIPPKSALRVFLVFWNQDTRPAAIT
jgi:hypothetical protein